jgi:hypothetical protein
MLGRLERLCLGEALGALKKGGRGKEEKDGRSQGVSEEAELLKGSK